MRRQAPSPVIWSICSGPVPALFFFTLIVRTLPTSVADRAKTRGSRFEGDIIPANCSFSVTTPPPEFVKVNVCGLSLTIVTTAVFGVPREAPTGLDNVTLTVLLLWKVMNFWMEKLKLDRDAPGAKMSVPLVLK